MSSKPKEYQWFCANVWGYQANIKSKNLKNLKLKNLRPSSNPQLVDNNCEIHCASITEDYIVILRTEGYIVISFAKDYIALPFHRRLHCDSFLQKITLSSLLQKMHCHFFYKGLHCVFSFTESYIVIPLRKRLNCDCLLHTIALPSRWTWHGNGRGLPLKRNSSRCLCGVRTSPIHAVVHNQSILNLAVMGPWTHGPMGLSPRSLRYPKDPRYPADPGTVTPSARGPRYPAETVGTPV